MQQLHLRNDYLFLPRVGLSIGAVLATCLYLHFAFS